MAIPRPEHPNPQLERADWENLNGEWEFEIDKSNSGMDRRLYLQEHLSGRITVPFCPESRLSGVGETDFLNSVWYKRTITVRDKTRRVLLHIGACDYLTHLFVNGNYVGHHKGGYTAFSFDITDFVSEGENTLVIHAQDDNRTGLQPRGKQSAIYHSCGCDYTRTTGIWQTVWLEYRPQAHIESLRYYPEAADSRLTIHAKLKGSETLTAVAYYEGREMGRASVRPLGDLAVLTLDLAEAHLWEPGHGRLYDLELTYGEDRVKSYFGLRNVCLDGYAFRINGKSIFQRTVLDQGFYPEGIYTAPTDADLQKDIRLSMDAGFNGARLHEKVFEPRFLYHCDKMGYLVWGEYGNWGLDHTQLHSLPTFLREWEEAVERDFNHPAIIGWCPFNETWDRDGRQQIDEVLEMTYRTTKQIDTTRPCIDTSGGFHVLTDVFDSHDYTQNPEELREHLQGYMENNSSAFRPNPRRPYGGEAIMVSEYGGIQWDVEKDIESWGYGNAPKTPEEFLERYRALTEAILACPRVFGFCYTQLYDVEQEKNGLYTYDRQEKFDPALFHAINTQPAALEKED